MTARHLLGIAIGLLLVLALAAAAPNPRAAGQTGDNAALLAEARLVDAEALRLAIDDLSRTFGARYPKAAEYRRRLAELAPGYAASLQAAERGDGAGLAAVRRMIELKREALLANPLLDLDRLLLVRRNERQMGLPQNWESQSSLPMRGYDNEIAVLSPVRPEGRLTTLYKPADGRYVGDLDLHFDATRLLLTMPGDNGRWQVFEMPTAGGEPMQLPLIHEPDVDNYSACYLPDGATLFSSTAPFVGVPCVTGSSHVSNFYRLETSGAIRRLTFEQDHDWCPTVAEDGRVMYLRWEYTDIPHFVARRMFSMNPDGTNQLAMYGSNGYWPNSSFYTRPIPGYPTQYVTVVGGHHGVARMGELVLFDTAKGSQEAAGAVQRIPGRGKPVQPVIVDHLVDESWPKFLHPRPLSDKYFLVSCKPTPQSKWGIYLADTLDNLQLIRETPDGALLEPIPLRPRKTPPVIPSRVRPDTREATVAISDIYAGPGLRGVPRGTVKRLRVLSYQFAYHNMGGQVNRVGLDGPWDVKRIIGTVPVMPDGSAYFRIPANTPISIQPLDADGKAIQLMRSWMTAMPGETLSCVGCHAKPSGSTYNAASLAAARRPTAIAPWYGPMRGFGFRREVQPVLDRYCVSCHGGSAAPDLRERPDEHPKAGDPGYNNGTHFPPSYVALRSYVRTPTIESDIHLLDPYEYHADTTRLVRTLRKGHHGVTLSAEGWDRLVTWIDLNTPAHGTWTDIVGPQMVDHQRERRVAMDRKYANLDDDAEAVRPTVVRLAEGTPSGGVKPPAGRPSANRPPDGTRTAALVPGGRRSVAAAPGETRTVDLGGGVSLRLVRLPAGGYQVGDAAGEVDELPVRRVSVGGGVWMGALEITNRQYALYDPTHDSRLETGDFLQFSARERGYAVNAPDQPVCRVSWREAMAFCDWLTRRTQMRFSLPTEDEWEAACRAGSTTPMSWGAADADFGKLANLADHSLRFVDTFDWGLPSGAVPPWRPAIDAVNDGHRVSAPVGSYPPNAWGLQDMHGNVAEWTASAYQSLPGDRRVVRGGSWYDRPKDARASSRAGYYPWQRVFDVGFRVVLREGDGRVAVRGR